jgi:two-component sensor histidine kinase
MRNPPSVTPLIPLAKRDRFLSIRLRYWRLGLVGFGIGAIGIVLFGIALIYFGKLNLSVSVYPIALLLIALFCGWIFAADTARFEKKALAHWDIDADSAYDQNIFDADQVRTIEVVGKHDDVFRTVCDALFEYGAVIDKRDMAAGLVEANTSNNLIGYGERIWVSISGSHPCQVSIRSFPPHYFLKLPLNYGRSWENVRVLAERMATGAFPARLQRKGLFGSSIDNIVNTPSSQMEAGAWPRLLAYALLYMALLLTELHKPKMFLAATVVTVFIGLELFAFLRFRRLAQSRQRSDPQKAFEAVLNMGFACFFIVNLIEPQQDWQSGINLIAIALIFVFLLTTLGILRQQKRQQAERVAMLQSRDKAELERQLSDAKLVALSAQIEPHFLFNTLASIQYLIRNDTNKAGEMTSDLIRYLRLALPRMKQATARLADELDLVRAYLGIMQIRMGARLQFAIDSPDDLSDVQIPTMTLITLVENAIKHGLEQKPNGGAINLAASRDAYDPLNLRLEVADTGGGFSTATSGTGIGLANIRERLNTLYGSRAQLELEANQPSGVKAILIIPIERK